MIVTHKVLNSHFSSISHSNVWQSRDVEFPTCRNLRRILKVCFKKRTYVVGRVGVRHMRMALPRPTVTAGQVNKNSLRKWGLKK